MVILLFHKPAAGKQYTFYVRYSFLIQLSFFFPVNKRCFFLNNLEFNQ